MISQKFLLLILLFSFVFKFKLIHAFDYPIKNEDFKNGTLILDSPGIYYLEENIIFDPNPPLDDTNVLDVVECCKPKLHQFKSNGGIYDDSHYILGFFTVISVIGSDITIDLNGYSIEVSERFALMQRFASLIELATSPFVPSQGPANFGLNFNSGENIIIRNGKLGLSPHHAIHGNSNKNVLLEYLDIENFEVAAIHFNAVDGLEINHVNIITNRLDIPVLGIFSAATFIRPFLNFLKEENVLLTLRVKGIELDSSSMLNDIDNLIYETYTDLIIKNNDKIIDIYYYELVGNKDGLIDGNCYGIVTNSFGVAVNGFPSSFKAPFTTIPSKNIKINNVLIQGLKANINEIVAIGFEDSAINDPVGALFQIFNKYINDDYITIESYQNDHVYIGNPISNAQAFVGKAIINKLFDGSSFDVSRNKINHIIITWIESYKLNNYGLLSNLTNMQGVSRLCGGDSMFHVNKGLVAVKIDGTHNFDIENCNIQHIENYGKFENIDCDQNNRNHPSATLDEYQGSNTRGFSFSGSHIGSLKNSYVEMIHSSYGKSIAYDILQDSNKIDIENCDGAWFYSFQDKQNIGIHLSKNSFDNIVKNVCFIDDNNNLDNIFNEANYYNEVYIKKGCHV